MAAVASLWSISGTMEIYSLDAVEIVAAKLFSAAPDAMLTNDEYQEARQSGNNVLLDGYDIEAWSKFARHKSRIASAICRENGRLQAELNALAAGRADADTWVSTAESEEEAKPKEEAKPPEPPVVKNVPVPQVQTVENVKVPEVQLVEKVIETPQVQGIEKEVAIPQTMVQEVVGQVPRVLVQEVVKQVQEQMVTAEEANKLSDRASGIVLNTCATEDPKSKVACETATKDNIEIPHTSAAKAKPAAEEVKIDRDSMLIAVPWNGYELEYATEKYQNDWEVVLVAVNQNGDALQFASNDLKNDREIVLAAVTQHGYALQYASEDLKNDRDVVLAAVTQNSDALYYASKELKNNRDVVLAAVTQFGFALQYASEGLKNDRDVVLAAVSCDGEASQLASENLRNDPELARVAIACHGTAMQYASEGSENESNQYCCLKTEYVPVAAECSYIKKHTHHACVARCKECMQGIGADEDMWWCHLCGEPLHAESFAACKMKHEAKHISLNLI